MKSVVAPSWREKLSQTRIGGTPWVELRGKPIRESLEFLESEGSKPEAYAATLKVNTPRSAEFRLLCVHPDQCELESQCQRIIATGDVVVSGPLLHQEEMHVVIVTGWSQITDN